MIGYTLTLTVGVHQFFKLGCTLYLEENLFSVLYPGRLTWLLTLRFNCSGGTVAIKNTNIMADIPQVKVSKKIKEFGQRFLLLPCIEKYKI
jgi:hypothetical protein